MSRNIPRVRRFPYTPITRAPRIINKAHAAEFVAAIRELEARYSTPAPEWNAYDAVCAWTGQQFVRDDMPEAVRAAMNCWSVYPSRSPSAYVADLLAPHVQPCPPL